MDSIATASPLSSHRCRSEARADRAMADAWCSSLARVATAQWVRSLIHECGRRLGRARRRRVADWCVTNASAGAPARPRSPSLGLTAQNTSRESAGARGPDFVSGAGQVARLAQVKWQRRGVDRGRRSCRRRIPHWDRRRRRPPRPWHLRPHGGALPGRGADRMNRLAGCPSRPAAEPVVRLAPTDRAARRFGRRPRSCRLPCPWQASAPSPRRWPTPW
jgi:hypothetical protein